MRLVADLITSAVNGTKEAAALPLSIPLRFADFSGDTTTPLLYCR